MATVISHTVSWLLVVLVVVVVVVLVVPFSHCTPFVVLHGINDDCSGVREFVGHLSNYSGSPGYCIEVGDGKLTSWLVPLEEQTRAVCDKVKQMKELSQGYNLVGQSQGNLIGRGVIEFCDGAPPVKNYISLAGPHAGIASAPLCGSESFCQFVDELIKSEVYSEFVQDNLAPSGYLKIPKEIERYLENCKYLPKLNNELPSERNSTYKERFSSLQNLVLIMFENDEVLVPKETSWFGYYPDGAFEPVLSPQQTRVYTEDWIGLKTLDDAGKVQYIRVPGAHVQLSTEDMKKYVVPYLQDHPALKNIEAVPDHEFKKLTSRKAKQSSDRVTVDGGPTKVVLDGSHQFYDQPPQIRSFSNETTRLTKDNQHPH